MTAYLLLRRRDAAYHHPLYLISQMIKRTYTKIFALFLISISIYFLTNSIYLFMGSKETTIDNFVITIDRKDCINCFWLDSDMKKTVKVSRENKTRIFHLTSPTQTRETRIVLGTSIKNSKLQKEGINKLICFPNELEKLEAFDFETGEDLNMIENGKFIWDNYYSDNTLNEALKELEVEIDVIVK